MKQVIIITDGDRTARKVVERVAANVGGRCISLSAGNPTKADEEDIAASIKRAAGNPVLVMVDDGGLRGSGPGERILARLGDDPEIQIIGAAAVASWTSETEGVPVGASVDRSGRVVTGAVDKDGKATGGQRIHGDTVDVLNRLQVPVIIGLGDLGKMEEADEVETGARITTAAVREIMRQAGTRENCHA